MHHRKHSYHWMALGPFLHSGPHNSLLNSTLDSNPNFRFLASDHIPKFGTHSHLQGLLLALGKTPQCIWHGQTFS